MGARAEARRGRRGGRHDGRCVGGMRAGSCGGNVTWRRAEPAFRALRVEDLNIHIHGKKSVELCT